MMFTVVTPRKVLRVNARGPKALLEAFAAARAVGKSDLFTILAFEGDRK